jgi:hypothetical protein
MQANQKSAQLARGTGVLYRGGERVPYRDRFNEEA